ncbi:hypothetical protein AAG906_032926 [Vitis piasezkii]
MEHRLMLVHGFSFICKDFGHIAWDCPKKFVTTARNKVISSLLVPFGLKGSRSLIMSPLVLSCNHTLSSKPCSLPISAVNDLSSSLTDDQVSGKMIAKGPKVGRLFPLHVSPSTIIPSFPLLSFACNVDGSGHKMWHRRLGHPNSDVLHFLQTKGSSLRFLSFDTTSNGVVERKIVTFLMWVMFVMIPMLVIYEFPNMIFFENQYFFHLMLTRLVARVTSSEYGVDYEETFALVAKMTTVRTILAIAASQSWQLHQMDVKNVYLHGLEVHHRASGIFVNQHKYIQDFITLAGLEDTSSVDTSMEVNVKYRKDEGDLLDDPTLYRRLVRISLCLLLGISILLQFEASSAIFEAEYRAMSTACSEIVWLRGLLEELGFPQTTSTPLHADNTSAIQIATNPVFHERTKHIEVDCHSIRDTLESRVISLPHISSDLQVADVFTKALTRQRHQFLVGKLLLVDLPASI